MGVANVPIELDRPRKLRFDHNALADLDAELIRSVRRSMFAIFADVDEETGVPYELAGFAGTRLLLWAGLKGEDPSLTIRGAGDLMGQYEGGLEGLMTTLWQAMSGSGVLGDLSKKPDPTEAEPATQKMPTA